LRIITLLFLLCIFEAYGDKIKFEHLNVRDGLPSNQINAILQDKLGFLWFATDNGIAKYDGKKFKIYQNDKKNTNSLNYNLVWDIYQDNHGYIWCATQFGLSRFNPRKEKFRQYFHNSDDTSTIANNLTLSFCQDSTGVLWIGTDGGILHVYNYEKDNFIRYDLNKMISTSPKINKIVRLLEDNNHILWIGTTQGLYSLNSERTKLTYHKPSFKNYDSFFGNSVRCLYQAKKGYVWIGTIQNGANIYDKKLKKFIHMQHIKSRSNSLASNSVYHIIQDDHGIFWFGSYGSGITTFNPHNGIYKNYKYNIEDANSLSDNKINSIYKSKSGIIWIGTYLNGVNIFDYAKQRFHTYTPKSYNHNDITKIRLIGEDLQKNIWFVTAKHLYKYTDIKDVFTKINTTKQSKCYIPIKDIQYRSMKGNIIFLGTKTGHLYLFNTKTNSVANYTFNENIKNIQSQNKDSNTIWIATTHELFSLDLRKHKLTKLLTKKKLKNRLILSIYIDKKQIFLLTNKGILKYDLRSNCLKIFHNINYYKYYKMYKSKLGDIWLLGIDGVVRIDSKNKETFYPKSNPKSAWSTIIIKEDMQHNIWLIDNLLVKKYDPHTKKIVIYSTKDGLHKNSVLSVLEDKKGNVWFIHSDRISKFNKKTEQFNSFSRKNRIQLVNFSKAIITSAQNIFVSGKNGILKFSSKTPFAKGNCSPITVISDIRLFNESIPLNKKVNGRVILKQTPPYCKEITLRHDETFISIEFAVLEYRHQKHKVRYILKGFEDNWNYIIDRNILSYKHLTPGTYTLIIQSSTKRGRWGKQATLKINITAPYWMTWWFKLFCIIIALLVIFLAYILWIKKLIHTNQQLRNQIVKRQEIERELEAHRDDLEKIVLRRTKELKNMHKKLIDAARLAGRAEIANEVLHNAGNILNSIKVNLAILEKMLKQSKGPSLKQIAQLLDQPKEKLSKLLSNKKKGAKIPTLLKQLGKKINKHHSKIEQYVQDLKQHIDHITQIIKTPSQHTQISAYTEKITIDELINDVVKISENELIKHNITISILRSSIQASLLDRHKIMQILINLIQNAKDSLIETNIPHKYITIKTYLRDKKTINIEVIDNGLGIDSEKLNSIFNIGYTNKTDGHGFGLHSAANAASEMNGSLEVKSAGKQKGATFILQLPFIT